MSSTTTRVAKPGYALIISHAAFQQTIRTTMPHTFQKVGLPIFCQPDHDKQLVMITDSYKPHYGDSSIISIHCPVDKQTRPFELQMARLHNLKTQDKFWMVIGQDLRAYSPDRSVHEATRKAQLDSQIISLFFENKNVFPPQTQDAIARATQQGDAKMMEVGNVANPMLQRVIAVTSFVKNMQQGLHNFSSPQIKHSL